MDAKQAEGDLIEEVHQYLADKSYPKGSSLQKKRTIRRKAEKFALSKDGELLYKHMQKGKVYSQILSNNIGCNLW